MKFRYNEGLEPSLHSRGETNAKNLNSSRGVCGRDCETAICFGIVDAVVICIAAEETFTTGCHLLDSVLDSALIGSNQSYLPPRRPLMGERRQLGGGPRRTGGPPPKGRGFGRRTGVALTS